MDHLFIYLIVAISLCYIPFFGKYFSLFNTLFHEIGHCLFSILTNGEVYKIKLNFNNNGLAITRHTSKFSSIIISLAGYPFASFIAFFSFYILNNEKYNHYYLISIGFILLLTLIIWIRNLYGIIWSLSMIFLISISYIFLDPNFILKISYVLAFILLFKSTQTALTILKLSFKDPNNSGDALSLKNATFVSTKFWGILFFLQSLFFVYITFKHYLI